MKITLQKLHAQNFKGFKDHEVTFTDRTDIVGDNGTGKTSLVDAFMWLLFGKDSQDRKDFNVKPLDSNNEPLHRLEYMVEAELTVDESSTHLKRILIEKWQKKRGATEAEFTGHETLFFVNDVPYQAGDYAKYIASIIPEEMFKLVTSPSYFNSMDWVKRRKVLIELAGEVSNEEILMKCAGGFDTLNTVLTSGKSFEQYKSEITAKKKNLKTQLDQIKPRVDEVSKGMPEEDDWEEIEGGIIVEGQTVARLDIEIADRTKEQDAAFEAANKLSNQKHAYEAQLTQLRFNNSKVVTEKKQQLTADIETATRYITSAQTGIENNNKTIADRQGIIKNLESEKALLAEKWQAENARVFVPISQDDLICPTCKQDLPEDLAVEAVEHAQTAFNNTKRNNLTAIELDGNAKKKEIARHLETVTTLEQSNRELVDNIENKSKLVIELNETLEVCNMPVIVSEAETTLQAQIDAIVIPTIQPVDISDLQAQRKAASDTITDCKLRLAKRDQITAANERIEQLLQDEKNYAQQLADLEKTEFAIDEFNRLHMQEVERRVSSLFTIVKFKMFNTLINGGTEDCCICMVNGVPYSDLNTAMQVNAGMDIINALSKYYGISAPIWIDKKESVTSLLPTEAQVITLSVVEGSKLRVL